MGQVADSTVLRQLTVDIKREMAELHRAQSAPLGTKDAVPEQQLQELPIDDSTYATVRKLALVKKNADAE